MMVAVAVAVASAVAVVMAVVVVMVLVVAMTKRHRNGIVIRLRPIYGYFYQELLTLYTCADT